MSKKILCKVCVKKGKETDITESFTLSEYEALLFDQYLRAKHVEEPPIGYYVNVYLNFDSRTCIAKFEASTSVLFHECELKFPEQLTDTPDIFDEDTEPHELVSKVMSLLCNQCDIENSINYEKDDDQIPPPPSPSPPQKPRSQVFNTNETNKRLGRPDNCLEFKNTIQHNQSQFSGQTEHQPVETSTGMSQLPQLHEECIDESANTMQVISTDESLVHYDSCNNYGQQDTYGLTTPQTEHIYQSYRTMGTCSDTYYDMRSDAYNCAYDGTCNNGMMYQEYNTLTSGMDQIAQLQMILNEDILVIFSAGLWSRCRCRLVKDSRVSGYAVQVGVRQAEPMPGFFNFTPVITVQVVLEYSNASYLGQGRLCTFQGGYCLFLY